MGRLSNQRGGPPATRPQLTDELAAQKITVILSKHVHQALQTRKRVLAIIGRAPGNQAAIEAHIHPDYRDEIQALLTKLEAIKTDHEPQ
jgi:hypothetical protein